MSTPVEDGGISLLDIKARNKAIQIMWLKKYMTTGPNRPLWVPDNQCNIHTPTRHQKDA
jgi:hypothetical protein